MIIYEKSIFDTIVVLIIPSVSIGEFLNVKYSSLLSRWIHCLNILFRCSTVRFLVRFLMNLTKKLFDVQYE